MCCIRLSFMNIFGKPSFDVFAAECIFRCGLTRDFYPSYFSKLITQAHSDCILSIRLYLFPGLATDSHINSDLGFDWSNLTHKYFVLKHSASCVYFDYANFYPNLLQRFTAFLPGMLCIQFSPNHLINSLSPTEQKSPNVIILYDATSMLHSRVVVFTGLFLSQTKWFTWKPQSPVLLNPNKMQSGLL